MIFGKLLNLQIETIVYYDILQTFNYDIKDSLN
jgi:hypothetical protein